MKKWADPAGHTVAYVGPCEAGLNLGPWPNLSLGLATGLCLGLELGLN